MNNQPNGRRRFAAAALFAAFALASLAAGWAVLGRTSREARARECLENLTLIDEAIERWALDNNKKHGDPGPAMDELAPPGDKARLKEIPGCPSGGKYVIGPIGTDPRCTSGLPGHSLSEVPAQATSSN